MWIWRWRVGRGADERCFRRKAVARFVCYTTRCDFIFRWRRGQPATDNQMPQRYDSRAASSSDCTSCSTCGSSSCPPRVASCSTCCAAGSWWVATHAASSLGVDTAKPQALACADARRWHHGPAWRHGGPGCLSLSRAWSNPEPGSSELCRHQEATFQPAAPPLASLRAW